MRQGRKVKPPLAARSVHLGTPCNEAQYDATGHHEGLENVELVNGSKGEEADAQRSGWEGADGVHIERHAEHGGKDEADGRGVHTCAAGVHTWVQG